MLGNFGGYGLHFQTGLDMCCLQENGKLKSSKCMLRTERRSIGFEAGSSSHSTDHLIWKINYLDLRLNTVVAQSRYLPPQPHYPGSSPGTTNQIHAQKEFF